MSHTTPAPRGGPSTKWVLGEYLMHEWLGRGSTSLSNAPGSQDSACAGGSRREELGPRHESCFVNSTPPGTGAGGGPGSESAEWGKYPGFWDRLFTNKSSLWCCFCALRSGLRRGKQGSDTLRVTVMYENFSGRESSHCPCVAGLRQHKQEDRDHRCMSTCHLWYMMTRSLDPRSYAMP